MIFSSNFFNLDANFFGNRPFLVIRETFPGVRGFSSGKSALSVFLRESFSFLELALYKFHFFLQKMLITATTAVTLPVFAVLIAISSALMLLIGAVLATLIGWGSVDN